MSNDLRHRYAEAIAAKFTEPVYRSDRDGSNERVENPEPADRVEQTPRIVVTAGDGHPSFRMPTCMELAEAVAAVPDEELERLREERDQAIAHDRQPYPTQWAYDQACAALAKHRERADELAAKVADYENAISYGTDSVREAQLLDECRRQEERAEKAEQRAERFRDLYSKRYSAIEQVRHVCQKAKRRKNAPGMWLVAEQVLAALDDQDAASLPPEVSALPEEET